VRKGLEARASARRGHLDRRNIAPELLEAVVGSRVRREDVQDDVEVVAEDPARLLRPVRVPRQETVVGFEALAHLVVDRLRLPRVLARADDEVVGVEANRPHVENHDVFRQLALGEVGDATGLLETRQVVCSFPWMISA